LEGGETTCTTPSSQKISGYYTPGTFQQYLCSPAHYVTPIPESIAQNEELLAGAAPLMCGGVTVYTALKRANIRFNDWVLVCGAGGGLGHLGIQYAKALGARVVGLDIGAKEEFCKSLGVDAFLDFTKFDEKEMEAKVKEVTGGGARIILQCSSSVKAYAQAVGWLGFRGTLVCLGVVEGEEPPIGGAKVGPMISQELTIFGTY
jgi:propanol-preferring alcohol dehydrogenase